MKIQQTTDACKPLNSKVEIFFSNSISIPNIWYHEVLLKNGKPDHVGITILSELLGLHFDSGEGQVEFFLSYPYFKNKFNYTYEQVYEAFVRLEKTGLIGRDRKNIVLNLENLMDISVKKQSNSIDKNDTNDGEAYALENKSIADENTQDKSFKDKSLNIDLYIDIIKDIEVKREEYISGSSLNKNPPEQNQDSRKNPNTESQGLIQTAKKWAKSLIRQPIAKFHPLTEEDAEHLRLSSGREFNLHFINQLVLHLGAKYPNHGFYTKKLFLKYMTAILAAEMRQAVNVNNEGFRFKRTDEEGVAEEYLAKVEETCGNKASDRIRQKIAASFEPTVAYKILTSCYFPEEAIEGNYKIRQRSNLELSASQQDRLYSQISAVFGDSVRHIAITNSYTVAKKVQFSTSVELQAVTLDTTTLWGRVRSSLIDLYGEAIDKSWFSRLETAEDLSSRSLILKGASFLIDYVQTNYSYVIERLCREENYQLKFC